MTAAKKEVGKLRVALSVWKVAFAREREKRESAERDLKAALGTCEAAKQGEAHANCKARAADKAFRKTLASLERKASTNTQLRATITQLRNALDALDEKLDHATELVGHLQQEALAALAGRPAPHHPP